jgi:hypothetical protein
VYFVVDYFCGPFGAHCDPDCNYICRRNLKITYKKMKETYPVISPINWDGKDVINILHRHSNDSCKYEWVAGFVFYSNIPVLIMCQSHKDSIVSWRRGNAIYVLLVNGDIHFVESYEQYKLKYYAYPRTLK